MNTDDILELPDEDFAGKDPASSQEVRRVSVKQLKTQTARASQLTKWAKEPTVMDLKVDLNAAKSSHDTQVNNVRRWTELRDGGKQLKKRRGRSSVRPKLIRRQAEWRYSALSEPFLSSDKIFKVSPQTFEDTEAASQNELLLNWQFRTKLNPVKLIDETVRTAVDEGTTVLRVGWDRQTKKQEKTVPVYNFMKVYEGSPEEQTLIQALELREQNPRAYEELDPAIIASIEYSEENQQTAWAVPDGEEVIQEDVVIKNQPTVEVIDHRNIYLDPSCKGVPENAKFVIMSFETSKGDLQKDSRYKNLKTAQWASADILNEPDHHTETPSDFNFKDDLRKRVIAYEYWGVQDIYGTGELVPIVATWIGDQMIRMELNPYPDQKPPFEFINYLPKKRSVFGEPDAELLEDNQKISGALTRGMIDLLGRSANAQQGIQKGLLDVTNRRRFEAGEDYEFNPNNTPTMGFHQHKYPEIPASALTMLNIQNQEAEGLTGVKSFSGGMSGDAYGDVAAGIKGALDAASKREMNILRRFAHGIKEVGSRIMAMNAVFLSEEEIVRVTNDKFVAVKREDIQGEFDMIVDISTPEIDEKRAQDMAFMLQTMGPASPFEFTQMVLAKIARLKRMPELAEQIENYEQTPDPIEEKKKELELAKLELELSEIESKTAKNRAHAEKLQADADATDLNTEMIASGTSHAQEMEKQSEQARGNQDLAVTRALTAARKEGEQAPSIEEAVGFNELSKQLSTSSNRPVSVLNPPNTLDPGGFPIQ